MGKGLAPIERYKSSVQLLFGTNATTIISSAVILNGLLRGILVTVPDLDSTNTATFSLIDEDGNVVYTKSAIAESTTFQAFVDTNNQPLQIPLGGSHTLKVVTSGSQTANRTFGVVLHIDHEG